MHSNESILVTLVCSTGNVCTVAVIDLQVLYKLAYTSSCKRDMAAEDWHKKYVMLMYLRI